MAGKAQGSHITSLVVRVVRATNLIAADVEGTSDPYCVLRYENQIFQTKTIKRTLNPTWNEEFEFRNLHQHTRFKIDVYDKDLGPKDDFIGCCEIHLAQLSEGVMTPLIIPLVTPKGDKWAYWPDQPSKLFLEMATTRPPVAVPQKTGLTDEEFARCLQVFKERALTPPATSLEVGKGRRVNVKRTEIRVNIRDLLLDLGDDTDLLSPEELQKTATFPDFVGAVLKVKAARGGMLAEPSSKDTWGTIAKAFNKSIMSVDYVKELTAPYGVGTDTLEDETDVDSGEGYLLSPPADEQYRRLNSHHGNSGSTTSQNPLAYALDQSAISDDELNPVKEAKIKLSPYFGNFGEPRQEDEIWAEQNRKVSNLTAHSIVNYINQKKRLNTLAKRKVPKGLKKRQHHQRRAVSPPLLEPAQSPSGIPDSDLAELEGSHVLSYQKEMKRSQSSNADQSSRPTQLPPSRPGPLPALSPSPAAMSPHGGSAGDGPRIRSSAKAALEEARLYSRNIMKPKIDFGRYSSQ